MATRSLIQKKLADLHPDILRKDINTSISIILESIISEVKNGSRYELRNFGSFFLKKLIHLKVMTLIALVKVVQIW